MDFAKDTFPLAVYGMQDVFSGYLVYLKVWVSNSNPKLVGRWYLEHLYKSKGNALCFDNSSTCWHFMNGAIPPKYWSLVKLLLTSAGHLWHMIRGAQYLLGAQHFVIYRYCILSSYNARSCHVTCNLM